MFKCCSLYYVKKISVLSSKSLVVDFENGWCYGKIRRAAVSDQCREEVKHFCSKALMMAIAKSCNIYIHIKPLIYSLLIYLLSEI